MTPAKPIVFRVDDESPSRVAGVVIRCEGWQPEMFASAQEVSQSGPLDIGAPVPKRCIGIRRWHASSQITIRSAETVQDRGNSGRHTGRGLMVTEKFLCGREHFRLPSLRSESTTPATRARDVVVNPRIRWALPESSTDDCQPKAKKRTLNHSLSQMSASFDRSPTRMHIQCLKQSHIAKKA